MKLPKLNSVEDQKIWPQTNNTLKSDNKTFDDHISKDVALDNLANILVRIYFSNNSNER